MPVKRRQGSPFYWYSFNINNRRFRGSTGKTTEREAKDVERAEYQRAKQGFAQSTDWTLQMVLSTYWNEYAKDKPSAYAIEGNFAYLQRILGKNLKTSELTSGKLIAYRAVRRGEKRKGRKPQPHTINRDFAYLRAAYQHCATHHEQPMPKINWKKLKEAEPPWRTRFLSRSDEAPRLFAVLPHNVREIVVCAIVTGLRKGVILRMDWRQVNLAERKIELIGKRGKDNSVTIPPALMAILSTRPPEKRVGKVFDVTNFRKRWEGAVKAAELHNFTFHDLRHTFGSWARKNRVDLPTIMQAMHHSSIHMTARYANVEPDEVETTFDGVSATLMDTISGTEPQKMAQNRGKADD